MGKSVKGTKTEQNLLKSFAGESQARTRYTFFASKAKKEGFEQIAGVFAETADQEKEHAERFFKFLEGGMLEITASYPAGKIRYRKLLAHVEAGNVFSREEEIEWQCRNCGYVHKGKTAPESCPACAHPQAYFEPMKHNY